MIVWLASYPRSGNTYCRSILKHYFGRSSFSIYGDPSDIGSNDDLQALVGHEPGDRSSLNFEELRAANELCFIKTHDAPNDCMSPEDTIFYIVRDGRDASCSYLKYLHNVANRKTVSLEDVLTGAVTSGFWGSHILSWHQAKFDRTFWFKYEEIIADPGSFADRLSTIIELPRSNKSFPRLSVFKNVAPAFFGSGKVGGYQNLFSERHLALFDLYNEPAMRLAGYHNSSLTGDEVLAYSVFCENVALSQRDQSALSEYRRRESVALEAVQEAITNLDASIDLLKLTKYETLTNFVRSQIGTQVRRRLITWSFVGILCALAIVLVSEASIMRAVFWPLLALPLAIFAWSFWSYQRHHMGQQIATGRRAMVGLRKELARPMGDPTKTP